MAKYYSVFGGREADAFVPYHEPMPAWFTEALASGEALERCLPVSLLHSLPHCDDRTTVKIRAIRCTGKTATSPKPTDKWEYNKGVIYRMADRSGNPMLYTLPTETFLRFFSPVCTDTVFPPISYRRKATVDEVLNALRWPNAAVLDPSSPYYVKPHAAPTRAASRAASSPAVSTSAAAPASSPAVNPAVNPAANSIPTESRAAVPTPAVNPAAPSRAASRGTSSYASVPTPAGIAHAESSRAASQSSTPALPYAVTPALDAEAVPVALPRRVLDDAVRIIEELLDRPDPADPSDSDGTADHAESPAPDETPFPVPHA